MMMGVMAVFSYDTALLADVIWSSYIELQKEVFDLRAKLETATSVVDTLRIEVEALNKEIADLESDDVDG